MTSRELIKRVIEFDHAERPGYCFNRPNFSDIAISYGRDYKKFATVDDSYKEWGEYPEILAKVPGFGGQVRMINGNIFGRLEGKTVNGECIKGAIEDGWEGFDEYYKNYLEPALSCEPQTDNIKAWVKENEGKFLVAPVQSLQAGVRDSRKMDNMLADTLLEPENIKNMVEIYADIACRDAEVYASLGYDGIIIYDDWGIQHSLYINPKSWREIWKGAYGKVAAAAHRHGLKMMLHSCGYIIDVIPDMIEAGIDVLQLDQPELFGSEVLGKKFGGKVTFFSPVDIQKIMATGKRELIESTARKMKEHLFVNGGGLIAKDYPTWEDIDVKDEWAQWARDIFMEK